MLGYSQRTRKLVQDSERPPAIIRDVGNSQCTRKLIQDSEASLKSKHSTKPKVCVHELGRRVPRSRRNGVQATGSRQRAQRDGLQEAEETGDCQEAEETGNRPGNGPQAPGLQKQKKRVTGDG
ncbi:uncharacterized protein BDZ99DRAFT_467493 [Mytilinidion resinicola]|uniref:Uncharacterized protein n=1 Tax=Mytilinidion resinicola TaxID=574789 RepID=A0A6A6Y8L2_9PEZI|nr:uncharacterized protein BDZ99DRAFT_467493 [Mytilinidion resinicola]KAF2804465.1 hypothetical protein BDZ99DRAFT_467493 [Mytilinidion resinicola]